MSEPEELDLVLKLFSGTATDDSNLHGSFCTATNDGICVYHNVIENPEESSIFIANYRIARGYISYADTLFSGIQHRGNQDDLDPSFDFLSIVKSLSSTIIVDTSVE